MHLVETIVTILLLFGMTIFVHELGHFLVARWCGMVVEVFSLGFGPALWKRKIGSVTYKIGVFPFGGYVALPQMDPGGSERPAGKKDEAAEAKALPPPVAPWKRILVSAAGATGNLLLALLLAAILRVTAEVTAEGAKGCVVGYVETNSVAYAQGLRIGDRIRAVNGHPAATWDDFVINSALAGEVELRVTAEDGAEKTMRLVTKSLPGVGRVVSGVGKSAPCLAIGVTEGSSAAAAGIRRKDLIVAIAGTRIYSFEQLTEEVNQNADRDIPITVLRSGSLVTLTVRPRYSPEYKRALIGVEFNRFDLSLRPLDQMAAWASPVFRILAALLTPSESRHAAEGLAGPVGILKMYWMAAQTHWLLALWLTGMLNVNLAILNLLPLPVLDGGHIVLALWEAVTRRPVKPSIVHGLWNVFALLLILAFAFLTYRDFRRMLPARFLKGVPAAERTTNTVPAPAQ